MEINDKMLDLEAQSMRDDLIFYGISKNGQESTEECTSKRSYNRQTQLRLPQHAF